MFLLKADYFLGGWFETMNHAEFIEPDYFADSFDYLLAVSHRWPHESDFSEGDHTAAADMNFIELRNRLETLVAQRVGAIAVFYDYSCIYQAKSLDDLVYRSVPFCMHGRSREYDYGRFLTFVTEQRRTDLSRLHDVYLAADEVFQSKYYQDDYYMRSWCLMECLIGTVREKILRPVEPYPFNKTNLNWHERFLSVASKLKDNLRDRSRVKAAQDFLSSGACMQPTDKALISQCFAKVCDQLSASGSESQSIRQNRANVVQVARSGKGTAHEWASK